MASLPIIIDAAKARTGAAEAKAAIDTVTEAAHDASVAVDSMNQNLDVLPSPDFQGGSGFDDGAGSDHNAFVQQELDGLEEQKGLQEEIERITSSTADAHEEIDDSIKQAKASTKGAADEGKKWLTSAEQIGKAVGGLQIGLGLTRGVISAIRGDAEGMAAAFSDLPFGVGQAFQLGQELRDLFTGEKAQIAEINNLMKQREAAEQRRIASVTQLMAAMRSLAESTKSFEGQANALITNTADRATAEAELKAVRALDKLDAAEAEARAIAKRTGKELSPEDTEKFATARNLVREGLGIDKELIKRDQLKLYEEQKRLIEAGEAEIDGIYIDSDVKRLQAANKFYEAEALMIEKETADKIAAAKEAARAVLESGDLEVDPAIIKQQLADKLQALEDAKATALELAKEEDEKREDPVDKRLEGLREEIELLQLSNQEREVARVLLDAQAEAEKENRELTKEEIAELESLTRAKQQKELEKEEGKPLDLSAVKGVEVGSKFVGVAAEFGSQRPFQKIEEHTKKAADILARIEKQRNSSGAPAGALVRV